MKRFAIAFVLFISFLWNSTAFAASSDLCPMPKDANGSDTPYFVRTRPLNGNNFDIYIPGRQFAWMGFPATAFLYRITNTTNWTLADEIIPWNGSWDELMVKYNTPKGEMYLRNSDNGVFFGTAKGLGDKLKQLTFPGNVLQVVARKYRRGQCFNQVATKPYTTIAPTYQETLSWEPWYWQFETTEQYATAPQINPAPKNNGNIRVPFVSKNPLWIPDEWVEAFPAFPMEITTQYNLYVREAGYGTPVIELAPAGTRLQLSNYYPLYNRTYGYVTDEITGLAGWVSLAYYPYPGFVLYTTDWWMESPPVPPG